MFSKFLHGAILGLIVVGVNYLTSPQKKDDKSQAPSPNRLNLPNHRTHLPPNARVKRTQ